MSDTARDLDTASYPAETPRDEAHRHDAPAALHLHHAVVVETRTVEPAQHRFADAGAQHGKDSSLSNASTSSALSAAPTATPSFSSAETIAALGTGLRAIATGAAAAPVTADVATVRTLASTSLGNTDASATASVGTTATAIPTSLTATSVPTAGTTEAATPILATTAAKLISTDTATTSIATPVSTTTAQTEPAASTAASFFTAGDLVISVYGDGDGSGTYTDNQAAPIVLEELTSSGAYVTQMTLPQTSTVVNGTTENAVSGEYGSSSEGTLELSGDGQSLVIAGYAVNAATYNAGGAAVYGNVALAQSTSIQGGQYTAVARVIADIGANGSVDSSTALYNIDNTNNPRSVATVNGSSFYISGQGVKGDATQGVFLAQDGASSATAIDTTTDTRTVEISNGVLYVSRDSKQGPTSSISSYGGLPTGATTATTLPGLAGSVILTAAQENTVNSSAVGSKVNLSPENFFFANSSTLYVADSGLPKAGTSLGDGGLQKWSLVGSTWTLDYTLSAGLNLVGNKSTSGTTGLIGLTGKVTGNSVALYATNATVGDLDQTYLYGITDTLSATTNPGESFTTLMTAAADTNIRGIAFAPTDAPCYAAGTMILTDRGERPVEQLRAGDRALVPHADGFRSAPIAWVGQRRVDIARHPDPDRVRPIRFAPGAIADGVPSRPLLLSPDHALLLDGVLVAARLLVNGVSVTIEDVPTVQYHHVELDRHDILLANNVLAESYLDTGNRRQFAGGAATALHACFDRAEHPAAFARLATDEATVQPIHRRLAERAGADRAGAETTCDPDLTLLLPDGRVISPSATVIDGAHRFWLPESEHAIQVVLRSRRQSPASLRPWLDDRRRLGVGVAGIQAWTQDGGLDALCLMPDPSASLPGWWPAGNGDPTRWTDGDAALTLPAGCVCVEVIVSATMNYAVAA